MKRLGLIDEIETRAEAARKTPRGPDYDAIIAAVAKEAGVPFHELEVAHSAWIAAIGTTG